MQSLFNSINRKAEVIEENGRWPTIKLFENFYQSKFDFLLNFLVMHVSFTRKLLSGLVAVGLL